MYDCQKYVWHNPQLPPASQRPDARSSFTFLPHESGAVLYGGYSRVKASTAISGKQKGGPQRMTFRPIVHQDTWFLRVTPPPADATASVGPTVRWERRKKPANPPNPARAGTTMAYHKGRGIMFGGVHDVEATEEGIDSEFYDTLYTWNTDRNRFFQVGLRRPRAAGKKQVSPQILKSRNRSKADEEELLRNLALLETKGVVSRIDSEDMDIDMPEKEEYSQSNLSLPVQFEMPHPRFNSQLAVQEDTLFIFGGTFERGDQEFTLNDMYSIDLVKLDGAKVIFSREPEGWHDPVQNDSDDEGDDGEDSEDEDDEDEGDAMSLDTAPTEVTEPTWFEPELDQQAEIPIQDSRPHPRPFESLREFFSRTSNEWQEILLSKIKNQSVGTEKTLKELRREAFDLAEEKWWDCREEITALEDEQEAAGIGEVVSIADRGDDTAFGGRRR